MNETTTPIIITDAPESTTLVEVKTKMTLKKKIAIAGGVIMTAAIAGYLANNRINKDKTENETEAPEDKLGTVDPMATY